LLYKPPFCLLEKTFLCSS